MKSSHLLGIGAALILAFVSSAVAGRLDKEPKGQYGDKLVFVTGSRIPQRVKVKSIGSATEQPVRVIKRGEIDASGRFTTQDVLALEPSVRVRTGANGGNN
jgi:outer membrane cobalamin receptor